MSGTAERQPDGSLQFRDSMQWDTRLSLDRHLVLPDPADPTGTKTVWPPHEVPLAAQFGLAYR